MGLGTLSLCLLARFSSLEAHGVRTAVDKWCPSEQHHSDQAGKVGERRCSSGKLFVRAAEESDGERLEKSSE
jgi:hypothetical protein